MLYQTPPVETIFDTVLASALQGPIFEDLLALSTQLYLQPKIDIKWIFFFKDLIYKYEGHNLITV